VVSRMAAYSGWKCEPDTFSSERIGTNEPSAGAPQFRAGVHWRKRL